MIYYFDSKNPKAPAQMGRLLTDMVTQKILPHQEIVILCIGSDRSTGDSLGPIIGHQFRNFISPGIYLLGDLNQPVHAANLNYCIKSMQKTFDNPFIIAIDASLGTREHIGYATLSHSPLLPGKGVNKKLPAIGNLSITGIVNVAGFPNSILLQSTRLHTVMTLATCISNAISWYFLEDYLPAPL